MPEAIIDGTGLTGSAMKVNEDGSLNVREQGFSSTANTSTTLPLSGGSIVGAWEQNAYPDVFNVVKTDVTGSIFLDLKIESRAEDGQLLREDNSYWCFNEDDIVFKIQGSNDTRVEIVMRLEVNTNA